MIGFEMKRHSLQISLDYVALICCFADSQKVQNGLDQELDFPLAWTVHL